MNRATTLLAFAALAALLPTLATAQTPPRRSGAGLSPGWMVGAGIGYYEYTTSYFYQTQDSDLVYHYYRPSHVFRRPQLSLFAERGDVLQAGSFQAAVRAEVHAGPFGGVREDWLPLGESISSGGLTLGAQAGVRFRYPYRASVTPYGGLALDVTVLTANGKDVGQRHAQYYDYEDGWTEVALNLPLILGVAVRRGDLLLLPELRFGWGVSGTDWEPGTGAPSGEGSFLFALVLGVARVGH